MYVRRVAGSSMAPTLFEGDVVVAWPWLVKTGHVVIARQADREVIKRVESVSAGKVYLLGDNRQESTDSRHYGKVSRSAILGTVMIVLPKAVTPPKLVKPYGLWLGRVSALLFVVMALVHLFRIDTFIPLLDAFLPGGGTLASVVALTIILSEIFAIPFALRMKLSPLGHYVSGTLVALAPFWWVSIDIWALGISENTAQLGEFYAVPGHVVVLMLNLAWLAFAYWTLYALGYGQLKPDKLLRK